MRLALQAAWAIRSIKANCNSSHAMGHSSVMRICSKSKRDPKSPVSSATCTALAPESIACFSSAEFGPKRF